MNRSIQSESTANLDDGNSTKKGNMLVAGGLLAALGASACCVLPFALLTLGVGGAWMSNISWLAPYEKIFVGAAVLMIISGFWRVYRRPATCGAGECAPPSNPKAKIGLWCAAALVATAIAFPYVAPWL
jgi:mercuric ion transport protein